jgi:hypothetical protein
MAGTPRITKLIFTLFSLAISSLSFAAEPAWLRLRSSEFTIYTDAPRRELEEFAVTYAAFRQVTRDLLLKPGQTPPASTIVLFRRENTFKKHVREPQDRDFVPAASSSEIDGTTLTTLSLAGDRDRALSLLFEFETIWMLGRLGYFLPTWIAQGSGKVLTSLRVSKSRVLLGEEKQFHFGDTRTLPWPRFFEINEASPEYRGKGSEDMAVYHTQAWSLMHWVLLGGSDTRDRFQRVAAELRVVSITPDVANVLDCPVANLDRELRRHFSRFKPREIPFDEAALRSKWTVEPAPSLEVDIQRAEILLSSDRIVEARAIILNLQVTASESPLVQEALARFALRENDEAAATTHYRRAIELGSKSPVTRLRSASARLDESSMNGADYPGNAGHNAAEAIAEIQEVLTTDPTNLEAYRLLGRALFVAPKLEQQDLEKLSPGIGPGAAGARVRFYRALLHLRLNQPENADEDFRLIADDPTVPNNDRQRARARLTKKPR